MWSGIDRRRFPRVNVPCRIAVRKKGQQDKFSIITENIGCGGVCVILPKNLGLFCPVDMEIDLGDCHGMTLCEGAVVWVVRRQIPGQRLKKDFDTGIEFVNLKEEDRTRIDKVIEEHMKVIPPSQEAP